MKNSKKTLLIVSVVLQECRSSLRPINDSTMSYLLKFIPSIFNAFTHPDSIYNPTLQFKQVKFGVKLVYKMCNFTLKIIYHIIYETKLKQIILLLQLVLSTQSLQVQYAQISRQIYIELLSLKNSTKDF
ncbi:unnamed protein product [Paramecium octaurelia]|uniref:Uncharacterized protein n=1 Tax=Paramecium octaurelia TaxID=43137 RepID=A0A8S1SKN0_PAROT|nr:unnamed protein product [Paramecium octaurelia]